MYGTKWRRIPQDNSFNIQCREKLKPHKIFILFRVIKEIFSILLVKLQGDGVVNGHECERSIVMCESNLFTLRCCVCVCVCVEPASAPQLSAEEAGFVGRADLIRWLHGWTCLLKCFSSYEIGLCMAWLGNYFASFPFNSFLHANEIVNINMYKTAILSPFYYILASCCTVVHLHPVAHCYYTFTFFFRLCAACQCLKHFIVFSTLVTF
jgi:hypothetical protein